MMVFDLFRLLISNNKNLYNTSNQATTISFQTIRDHFYFLFLLIKKNSTINYLLIVI